MKCLGKLFIILDQTAGHVAVFDDDAMPPEGRFKIEQNQDDGSTSLENLPFMVAGIRRELARPLNARTPWPLYVRCAPAFLGLKEDADTPVFSANGELTPEFWALIRDGR